MLLTPYDIEADCTLEDLRVPSISSKNFSKTYKINSEHFKVKLVEQ